MRLFGSLAATRASLLPRSLRIRRPGAWRAVFGCAAFFGTPVQRSQTDRTGHRARHQPPVPHRRLRQRGRSTPGSNDRRVRIRGLPRPKGYLLGGGSAARGSLIVGCMDTLPVSWAPMRWIAEYLVCFGSTESRSDHAADPLAVGFRGRVVPGGRRGGGSVARWLAGRAGSSGSVFAMDVDRSSWSCRRRSRP